MEDYPWKDLLSEPGRSGSFGAILDETARAADELSRLVARLPVDRYRQSHKVSHPGMASIRRICVHCVNCSINYSNFIRIARGRETDSSIELPSSALEHPQDLRLAFRTAFQHTEATLEGFWKASPKRIIQHTFVVPWGASYDPESILEHGLAHILRHRRQIERF